MYPVYETNMRVHTEIQELPKVPEFPTAAGISEFVAQVGEVVGHMNPISHGPTEPHLWQVGEIPPTTWQNCRKRSERKARAHCYDDSFPLLIGLAMERENDSHADKYLRNHPGRKTPAERSPERWSPQLQSNPGKGRA